jgi:hypothetical protein
VVEFFVGKFVLDSLKFFYCGVGEIFLDFLKLLGFWKDGE